jgi:Predicted acyl-CoA transferases/carnitine dehydratase
MEISNFFKGLKVIELASVLAGPSVGMFFAELGATVLKIENKTTTGDVTRKWKMPTEDPSATDSAYFNSINWGKEKLLLNLSDKKDYEVLKKHLVDTDLVISNFKTDSAKKLKLDYTTIRSVNSRIIYANISAYGANDNRPGFDVLMQAETGWLSINGPENGSAVKLPVALMDVLTAHQLKEGILLALLHRERTGKGSVVEATLYDSGVASLVNQASNWLNADHLPKRMGSQHPNIAPYGDILLVDGIEIILSTGTQRQFEKLLEVLGLSMLKEDPRFSENANRLIHRLELMEKLTNAATNLKANEFLTACEQNGVPVAPIRNLKMVFDDPRTQKLLLHGEDEKGHPIRVVRSVVFKVKTG